MKVLFLSPWFPYPPENGSKIRIYNLIKFLSNHHEVHVISFIREGEHVDPEGLKEICQLDAMIPWREFSPHSWKSLVGFFSPIPRSVIDTYRPQMAKQLQRSLVKERPNLIIASQVNTAIYAGRKWNIPCIFEEVELGLIFQYRSTSNSSITKLRKRLYWIKAKAYARWLVGQYDACTVVSQRERELLTQVIDDNEWVFVVPNGVDFNYYQTGISRPQKNTLIFNGALTYYANYDAMRYFLNEIFPLIRLQTPEVTLKITGTIQGVDISGLALDDRITFTGFLPDIRPVIAEAWACVVPLRLGGGTRLKIIEAMALGTPVIATTKAAEGLSVTPEKNILLADTAEEFSLQITRLFNDNLLRDELSKNGRELVRNNYNWDILGSSFEKLIESVMKNREQKCMQ